jgi:anaerobic ribonucleoside-triphosphate reductase activating protein
MVTPACIRLHNIILHTKVLGLGTRAAIWLQGGNRFCKGCMSDETWDLNGGKEVLIDDVYRSITILTDIKGITINDGEVFLQIDALHELLRRICGTTSFGVILYTGFYLSELTDIANQKVDEIIGSLTDIIIDGPYIDELNDGNALWGSKNQTVHFLTERYRYQAYLYDVPVRNVEMCVTDTDMFFVGIPDRNTLASWKKMAGKEEESDASI